ncbi:MAG TPA: M23 family metallopeptidase, partial [Chroococcales cyanobacterium]
MPALVLAPLSLTLSAAQALAEIKLSDDSPRQGETVEITVIPTDGAEGAQAPAEITFNKNTYKLFPDPGNPNAGRALVSIAADLKPGRYTVQAGAEEKTITAVDAKFPRQYLSLPKSKDNFIMSPGEEEAVDGAKRTVSDQRLWSGHFTAPSKARVSAAFGLKRVVNGKLLDDYFHSGLDYAGWLGSPICACGGGKVILAAHGYRLHGNVVAIDHGQGVVSFYLHMQKILVKVGQVVKGGEKIGLVGQTGRANGPHLHFSIYVNQVAANPNFWYKHDFNQNQQ